MNFQNNHSGNGGYISLIEDSKEIGRLTYTIFPEEKKLVISFVLVYPEFEGKGYGKLLVEEALNTARKYQLKVYPHCSYSRSVMNRMERIDDIYLK